jgi:Flp pilus assembly protein TadD
MTVPLISAKPLSDPRSHEKSFGLRGMAYAAKGDYRQAIVDLNEAIRLNSEDAKSWFYRGYAYAQLKDFDRAIPDYNQAISLNPKTGMYYYSRAKAYEAKGD